jgi:hypothetical protein
LGLCPDNQTRWLCQRLFLYWKDPLLNRCCCQAVRNEQKTRGGGDTLRSRCIMGGLRVCR